MPPPPPQQLYKLTMVTPRKIISTIPCQLFRMPIPGLINPLLIPPTPSPISKWSETRPVCLACIKLVQGFTITRPPTHSMWSRVRLSPPPPPPPLQTGVVCIRAIGARFRLGTGRMPQVKGQALRKRNCTSAVIHAQTDCGGCGLRD